MSDVIERRPFDSILDDLQIPFAGANAGGPMDPHRSIYYCV